MTAGFVLQQAAVGGIHPFGAAFFFAALGGNAPMALSAAVGVGVAAAVSLPGERALLTVAVLAAGWAIAGRVRRLRIPLPLLAAGLLAAGRLIGAGPLLGRSPMWWFEGAAEAAAAGALVALWGPWLAPAGGMPAEGATRRLLRQGGGCLLVGATCLGLLPFHLGPLHLAAVGLPLAVMLVATLLEPWLGVPVAALVGGLLPVAAAGTGVPRADWALYAVGLSLGAGFLAAVMPIRGRLAGLALEGGVLAVSLAAPGPGWVLWAAGHTAAAALLYAAIPSRWSAAVQAKARDGAWVCPAPVAGPGTLPGGAIQDLGWQWAYERLIRRLGQLHGLLEAFKHTYEAAPASASARFDEAVRYVDMVQQRACHGCPSFQHCWETYAHQTFWDVTELLDGLARAPQPASTAVPERLRLRCIQPARLRAAAADTAAFMEAVHRVQHEADHAFQRLMGELDAAARVVQALVDRVSREQPEAATPDDAADRLGRHLSLQGMPARAILVSPPRGREVWIELSGPCGAPDRCRQVLPRLVGEVRGTPYTVYAHRCRRASGEAPSGAGPGCWVALRRTPGWRVEMAIRSRARHEESSPGDSFARLDLRDGRWALVVSDGMGAGAEAARESAAAVAVVEAALNAGLSAAEAVHAANAVLLARATDERFATLDVVVVDGVEGELELVKAGAFPTFLARSGRVERLEGRAVPAGILERVDLESLRRPLVDGDFLVVATDGAGAAGPAGEAYLEEVLVRASTTPGPPGATELVEQMMEALDHLVRGTWPDDVTLAVLAVRKLDDPDIEAYTEAGPERLGRQASAAGGSDLTAGSTSSGPLRNLPVVSRRGRM